MVESDEILNNYIKDSNSCDPRTPQDIEEIKNALLQLAKIKSKNKKCRETLQNDDAPLTQAIAAVDKELIKEFIGDAASIKANRVAGEPGTAEGDKGTAEGEPGSNERKSETDTSVSETADEKGKDLLDPVRQALYEDHLANIKPTVPNNTVKAFLIALMDLPRDRYFKGEIKPEYVKTEFKTKFVEYFKILEPKKKIDAEELMTNLIEYMFSKYSVISSSANFDELIYNLCADSSKGGFWQLVQDETFKGNGSQSNTSDNRKLVYYLVVTDWLFGNKSNFNEAVKSIVDLRGVDLARELPEDIMNKIMNIYDFLHFRRPVGEDGRPSGVDEGIKFFEKGLTDIFKGDANSPGPGNAKIWFTFLSTKTSFMDWINNNFKGKNKKGDSNAKKMMYSLAYAAEYHKHNEKDNQNLKPTDMQEKNTEMVEETQKVIENILKIPRDTLFPWLTDIDESELVKRKQQVKDIIGGETIEKTITIVKDTSEQKLGLDLHHYMYTKKIPAKISKINQILPINKDFKEGDYIITVDGKFFNNVTAVWPGRPDKPYEVLVVRKKTDDEKGDDEEKPDPFDELDKVLTAENNLSELITKFNDFKGKTDEPDYAKKLKRYQQRLQELLKEEVDDIIKMPESAITNADKSQRLTKFKEDYKDYLSEVSPELNTKIDDEIAKLKGDEGTTSKAQSNNLTLDIIEGDIETYKKTEKAKLTKPDEYKEVEIDVTNMDDLKFNLDISGGEPPLFSNITGITGSDSPQKDDYILLIKIVNKEDTTTTKKISQVNNKEIELNIKDLYQTEEKPKEIKITVLRKNSAPPPPPPPSSLSSSPSTSSKEQVDIKKFNGALIRFIDTTTAKFGRQARNPFIYNEKKKKYFRPDNKYIGETRELTSPLNELNETYQVKTIEIPESKNQGKKDDFKIEDLKFQIETQLTDPNSTIFKAITDKTKNPAIIELFGLINEISDITSYLDRNEKSIKEIIKNYLIVKLTDYDKPEDIQRDINGEFSKLKEFIKNLKNSKTVKGLAGGGSKSRKKNKKNTKKNKKTKYKNSKKKNRITKNKKTTKKNKKYASIKKSLKKTKYRKNIKYTRKYK